MVITPLTKFLLCLTGGGLAYISLYNFCSYFHVDEKEVVKRLLAIKDRNLDRVAVNTNYSVTKDNFKFKIFSILFKDITITDKISRLLEQADIPWQVDTFFIVSIALGLIPLIFAFFFMPALAILSPVMLLVPLIYINITIKKRYLLFTQQLPDALDLLCNALRAGHSLLSAFEVIVKEMPSPISQIFKFMTDQITLGIDTKEAMFSLQNLMPKSVDLRFFTTVVILQREIGGNLIKLLEVLAGTIRERFKMIGQLKAQTMQAKLSGIIVSVIPPIIGVVLFIMAPDYMHYLLNHIIGKVALGVSIVLMIIGYVVINKITDIDI